MSALPANYACYDLDQAPASWDFSTWLLIAEIHRQQERAPPPLRVAFRPGSASGFRGDNLPPDLAGRRLMFEHVMRPLLGMVGAVEDATALNGRRYHYLLRSVVDAVNHGCRLPRFVPPAAASDEVRQRLGGRHPVVITLREANYWPQRNSNLDAWLGFAADLDDVVFVRDTCRADEPLSFPTWPQASRDVNIRAALYAEARMNFITSNGPSMLLIAGTAPYRMFKPLVADYRPGLPEWWAEKIGVPVGGNFPWASPEQRIVWRDDDLDAIRRS